MASVVLFAGLLAGDAWAEPTKADRLFLEGRELLKAGEIEEACKKFERAYELDKGPGIVANLADCRERFDEPAEAWRLFRDAAARWDSAAGAKLARERAEKLAKRLAIVVIGVPDPGLAGLSIAINGRRVEPASEIRDAFVPGEIELVAKAKGRPTFRRTRTAAAGETVVIELAFGVGDREEQPAREGRVVRRRSRVGIAVGLGVLGVAGVATGVGLGFQANSQYDAALKDHCMNGDSEMCDLAGQDKLRDAGKRADLGTVAGIAGGVLAAVGVIVYVTAPFDVVAAPIVGDRTAGISLSRRF